MFCTFLPFLNIPVFWPILVIYFICLSFFPFPFHTLSFAFSSPFSGTTALTFVTMKNQIAHMIKYKYLPWEYGKKKYVRPQEPKLFSD